MHDQTSSDWWSVVFCVFFLSSKTRKHVSNSGVRNRSTHMQRSECMRDYVLTAIAWYGRLTVGDRYRPFSSLAIVTMCMGQGPTVLRLQKPPFSRRPWFFRTALHIRTADLAARYRDRRRVTRTRAVQCRYANIPYVYAYAKSCLCTSAHAEPRGGCAHALESF